MRFRAPSLILLSLLLAVTPGCVHESALRTQGATGGAPAPGSMTTMPPTSARHDLARLHAELQALAPSADSDMLDAALQARQCAIAHGQVAPEARLAVIDYARPSTEPRLWVFDFAAESPRLLWSEHVAHGRGSGENLAQRFSNAEGSHQTSLGLFRTAETYVGGNGYSMRMDGLEPGINDAARERLIVMHGAWYVDPAQAQRQGRLGRSEGCPAVRDAIARPLIDDLKQGHLVYAWHSDRQWRSASRYLNCGATAVAAAGPARSGIHAAAK